MRYLYTFLLYLIMPFVLLRLFWRSRHLPAYKQRIRERFGFYPVKFEKSLWVHAVSVGETIAAVPLIKALQARYPTLPLVVTTMTATGALQVKTSLGDTVTHFYIPYDLPGSVKRFLKTIRPLVNVTIETELWPNTFAACRQQNIPICLMNARLSEKSARGYQRIASLAREMLQSIRLIAAHGKKDAERFIKLGAAADRVMVTGNIKFDISIPEETITQGTALRSLFGKDRFVWIAASTHEGEEEMILAAHQLLRSKHPDALLILVPRHPDRFDSVAKLAGQFFRTERRSQAGSLDADTAVYVGDTMGELVMMYSASDVAFVGGSLVPRGGHNIIEAGVLGKPILTGEHMFNFKEISELFIQADALTLVHNEKELAAELSMLLQVANERTKRGERACEVMAANRGALAKQLALIYQVIEN